jgi:hypothetical protein
MRRAAGLRLAGLFTVRASGIDTPETTHPLVGRGDAQVSTYPRPLLGLLGPFVLRGG